MVVVATVAAIVVVGAVVTAFVMRANVAGTPTPEGGVSTSAAPPSSSASSAVSSPGSGSATAPGTTVPVPGLPHSTPLPDQVLIGSRALNGADDLYQIDAATGAIGQRLTTGRTGAQFPVLSPDRGSMIYVQTAPGGATTLHTAAVDGSDDRELFSAMPADCTTFYRPAWDPAEQTQIALPCVTAAGSVAVHLLNVDGTEVRPISTGLPMVDDLTYSPDGRTLAFWGSQAQGVDGTIFTQPADGSAPPARLVQPVEGTGDADPTFSPDGSMIAFRRARTDSAGTPTAQLLVVGVDGSNPTPITDGTSVDQDPIWSPDGSQLAFKSNRQDAAGARDNQIWVINADGTGLTQLGIGAPGVADGAPAWGHR